ncbi:MAG: efflux RND transporter periplasmic adaptor subunit [Planctomycetes bacterium]|nr:efflux RND transporter periplasmic adaptor subunit [Planctomycetota bacterium]
MSESVHEPQVPPPHAVSRWVTACRIVSVRLRFIGLLILVMFVAATWDDIVAHVERWTHAGSHEHGPAETGVEWFCPMHPHVIRDEPGACPICGMPLSKRVKGEATKLPDGVRARVSLSPYRVAQAGVRTTIADWRPLEREVSTVGFLEFDERKLARIAARFPGRVTYVNPEIVTGAHVEKGQPVLTIWSPEIFSAEAAFVNAQGALPLTPDAAASRDSARKKLVAWGLTDEQIDAVAKAGTAFETVNVLAPSTGVVTKRSVVAGDYVQEGSALFDIADLSQVWLLARVYEEDLPLVTAGRKVVAVATAWRDQPFEGTVAFVEPTVDRASRTVGVRVELPNADGRLRPGMFVTATIRVPMADVEPWRSATKPPPGPPRTVYECPMHSVVRDEPGECSECGGMKLIPREIPGGPQAADVLAIPETAVVDTGRARVVYIESSPGVFDAHEVVLGPRAGAFYPVIRGVAPGARIATAGSFLLDAETRLDPAAAGTYFGASGSPSSPKTGEGK